MDRDLALRRPRRLAATSGAAATLALALVLGACSSGGSDSSTTTTTATTAEASTTTTTAATTSAPTTTAGPTTTAATTSTPTSTTAAPGALPTTADAYAKAMVAAWVAGDKATADRLGTEAAVNALFGLEGDGEEGAPAPTWTLDHCEGAAGSSYCTFTAGGSAGITLRLINETVSQGAEHAVTEVRPEG